jgi:D-proline reductase (dithiol) PrdB|tara:strand:+ start:3390 stop:3746 length:357 start_codon:yes stop_codon:yes gene_type:complete
VSLVARHLEENGIPTVIIGAARDIVEHCGVPRFVFTDFPLGSPCGEPFDVSMQQRIVAAALDLLETGDAPRTTVQMPLVWTKGEAWKDTVFTVEQPFLSGAQIKNWEVRKQRYRDQKS